MQNVDSRTSLSVLCCIGPVTAVGERKCERVWPIVVYF